jgi:4-aminobutyrate aminotransferase-like enzyme
MWLALIMPSSHIAGRVLPVRECVYLSSGSEVVEFAVQSARRVSRKELVLTFPNSYLAAYGSAGRKSAGEAIELT